MEVVVESMTYEITRDDFDHYKAVHMFQYSDTDTTFWGTDTLKF